VNHPLFLISSTKQRLAKQKFKVLLKLPLLFSKKSSCNEEKQQKKQLKMVSVPHNVKLNKNKLTSSNFFMVKRKICAFN
jgi:hypothetical protein